MKDYFLTFIEPVLGQTSSQRLIFRPNWAIILFVTTILTILGISLIVNCPISFLSFPLGIAFLGYALYHLIAGLSFKIVIDLPTQRIIKKSFLKGNQEIPFSEVKEVILKSFPRFTILLHLNNNQTLLLALYRNASNAEVKAYNTAALVAHFLKVNFHDKTLPALVEKKLKNSLHFINDRCVLIKTPLANVPLDFLIFPFVFFCFGLFIILILPPHAPWFVKNFFPLAAFSMGLFILILGYKGFLCPQVIEKDDKHLLIKTLFLGKICIVQKKYQERRSIGLFPDDMYIAEKNMKVLKKVIAFTLSLTASVTG